VWLKEPDLLSREPLSLLEDWNIMCMYLATLPLIVIFTLSQRNMVPGRIAGIVRGSVIPVRTKYSSMSEFVSSWNKRFKIVNVIGQLAGILVAVVVCLKNYDIATSPDFPDYRLTDGNINIAGWMYLCWQLPMFYWIAVVYISQGLALIVLLFRLNRNFEIEVFPFHRDNCGGLRSVGQIGLRNQYLLAVVGVNLLALWAVNIERGDPRPLTLLIAAGVAYVGLGPVVFLGPLIPFRKSMLSAKRGEQTRVAAKLQEKYELIMGDKDRPTKEDGEVIDSLQKLTVLINRIPVWPFDTSTLRRFFTAYVFPFLTALVSVLINYAMTALKAAHSAIQQ
jgi:hypothetical protein